MKIPLDAKYIKRIKLIRKAIKSDKGNDKKFIAKCSTVKGILVEMIKESIGRWEFIHQDMGNVIKSKKKGDKKK